MLLWDMYSGGGGSLKALKRAGMAKDLKRAYFFENDPLKRAILSAQLERNYPNVKAHIFEDVTPDFKKLRQNIGTPDLLWATPSCHQVSSLNITANGAKKENAITSQDIQQLDYGQLLQKVLNALGHKKGAEPTAQGLSGYTLERMLDAIEQGKPNKVFGEFGNLNGSLVPAYDKLFNTLRPGSHIVKMDAAALGPTSRQRGYLSDITQDEVTRLVQLLQQYGITDATDATRFLQQYQPGRTKRLNEIDWSAPIREDGDFYLKHKFPAAVVGSLKDIKDTSHGAGLASIRARLLTQLPKNMSMPASRMTKDPDGLFRAMPDGQVNMDVSKLKKHGITRQEYEAIQLGKARVQEGVTAKGVQSKAMPTQGRSELRPEKPFNFNAQPLTKEELAVSNTLSTDDIKGSNTVEAYRDIGDGLATGVPAMLLALSHGKSADNVARDALQYMYNGGYVK